MNFDPLKHTITVSRTARYFLSAPITHQTKQVWIVLHGYGQHAGYFLKKFEPLCNTETVFVAPEGLSRYYVKGASGHVGASWMTAEDRASEIQDYVGYLNQVLMALQLPEHVAVTVLGFSQGAATAARWISLGRVKPAAIVLYAGVFPPDVQLTTTHNWEGARIHILLGNQDVYYKKQEFNTSFDVLLNSGLNVNFKEFDGGHEIYPEVLRHLQD